MIGAEQGRGVRRPAIAGSAAETATGEGHGRDRPFDRGWRFFRGDGQGFEATQFDDTAWRILDLPHDWSIEDLPPQPTDDANEAVWSQWSAPEQVGPFTKSAGRYHGFTVGGVGWYRKRFQVLDLPQDGRVEILFDGVYRNSEVWFNGHRLGERVHGYTAFGYELTPFLDREGENVVAVRVRNLGVNSRWYPGSGIYRAVSLVVTGPARVARWGVGITTPVVESDQAQIAVRTKLDGGIAGMTLVSRIIDADGRAVAQTQAPVAGEVEQTLSLASPKLWSPEHPALYVLVSELRSGDRVLDRTTTNFGVRSISMDAKNGLRINGKPYKLRGGCVHHDNGFLGAAAFACAEERRVELLKARGFNAIRTAHNPPSSAFLDACDRLGMLVIDEAFDVWTVGKVPDDYHKDFEANWRTDLAAMVLRDRNHPSIIMWSIGNEIWDRLMPRGVEIQWMLAEETRSLDPSRPLTAAIPGFAGRPVVGQGSKPAPLAAAYLDVVGYNYAWREFEAHHALYPEQVMVQSESYPGETTEFWRGTAHLPYVLGDFVWTAMDHLGEGGVGSSVLRKADYRPSNPFETLMPDTSWPWISNYSGDLDLTGRQKPQSLARDVCWGLSFIEMTVQRPVPDGMTEVVGWWGWSDELRSWTWPGAEGHPLAVRVYTSGDRVELQLEGKTLAAAKVGPEQLGKVSFTVPYKPGRLVAIAWKGGREIGRSTIETVDAPAALRLSVDRPQIAANRNALCFVDVEVVDAQGRLVPDAAARVDLRVDGPFELVGFGNANPVHPQSFQSPSALSHRGHCLAVLRSTGEAGTGRLEARAGGLTPGAATLTASDGARTWPAD